MDKVVNYILVVKNEAELVSCLKLLARTSSWNPSAKFLIFVDWLECDWRAFISFIQQQLFAHFAVNVLVAIPTSPTDATLKLITWFSFAGNNCHSQIPDFVELGTCRDAHIQPSNINLFPPRVCAVW